MGMVYSFSTGRPVERTSEGKDALPIGTVLRLNGYNNPEMVVVSKIEDPRFHNGPQYACVYMGEHERTTIRHESHLLRFLSDKKDDRIQTYITDRVLPADAVALLLKEAEEFAVNKETARLAAETEKNRLVAIGKELFKKYIPPTAKALMMAHHEIDDCDMMTDYFSTKTAETVIVGYSNHTRDLFSEMRKFARVIPETAHLAVAPTVNGNGEAKTETNKSWWSPSDEHREKYSMGGGYYLKASGTYSTGWTINKSTKYGEDWPEYLYIAMAKRCVFEKAAQS